MEIIKKGSNTSIFLILLMIGCVFYFTVFFNGFVGDDKEQIYNYGLVKGILDLPKVFFYHHEVLEHNGSILSGYYKPLMLFFFYSIRAFFGLNPFFYHGPQIVLGIVNAFLVFIFFKRFLKQEVAFFCAIFFLLHPINQETMAYVSNIQEILFFLFGMSGLILITRSNNTKQAAISALLLLLSLLSKETGILFLFISGLYVFLFKKQHIKPYTLWFGSVLFFYLLLRLLSKSTSVFWIEPSPMSQLPLQDRILHIPSLFSYYVKTFIFPADLTFNQQWIIKRIDFNSFIFPLLISLFFMLLSAGTAVYLFLMRKKVSKIYLFFLLWFFVGILPHMQLIPLDATVADRWFYFSSVGILGIAGLGAEFLIKKKQLIPIIFSLVIILGIVLGVRTYARNLEWKDAFTLYSNDARKSQSALIENNLGDEYFKMGDLQKAKVHFQNALEINPNLWIAINNLGTIEEKKGNYKDAYNYYKKALEKNERLPVLENTARVLVLDKKPKEAISFIEPHLSKYPLSSNLWLILALAHYDIGEKEEALMYARKSFEIFPDIKTQNVIQTIEHELSIQK